MAQISRKHNWNAKCIAKQRKAQLLRLFYSAKNGRIGQKVNQLMNWIKLPLKMNYWKKDNFWRVKWIYCAIQRCPGAWWCNRKYSPKCGPIWARRRRMPKRKSLLSSQSSQSVENASVELWIGCGTNIANRRWSPKMSKQMDRFGNCFLGGGKIAKKYFVIYI